MGKILSNFRALTGFFKEGQLCAEVWAKRIFGIGLTSFGGVR